MRPTRPALPRRCRAGTSRARARQPLRPPAGHPRGGGVTGPPGRHREPAHASWVLSSHATPADFIALREGLLVMSQAVEAARESVESAHNLAVSAQSHWQQDRIRLRSHRDASGAAHRAGPAEHARAEAQDPGRGRRSAVAAQRHLASGTRDRRHVTSRIRRSSPSWRCSTPIAASTVQAANGTAFAQALDTASASSSSGGVTGTDIVNEAKEFLGLPYVWGGTIQGEGRRLLRTGAAGLQEVRHRAAASLGRAGPSGTPVASMEQAKPGDIIAWDNSSRNNGADHIAIYVGNGKMIEAPRTGLDVRLVDVPSKPDYIRRILPESGVSGASQVSGSRAAGGAVSGVPYADLFNQAGARYGVSPALLSAVAKQESGFKATRSAPPARGADAADARHRQGTRREPTPSTRPRPSTAPRGCCDDLITRFGSTQLALAAYNAGPGAVLQVRRHPAVRRDAALRAAQSWRCWRPPHDRHHARRALDRAVSRRCAAPSTPPAPSRRFAALMAGLLGEASGGRPPRPVPVDHGLADAARSVPAAAPRSRTRRADPRRGEPDRRRGRGRETGEAGPRRAALLRVADPAIPRLRLHLGRGQGPRPGPDRPADCAVPTPRRRARPPAAAAGATPRRPGPSPRHPGPAAAADARRAGSRTGTCRGRPEAAVARARCQSAPQGATVSPASPAAAARVRRPRTASPVASPPR